MANTDTSLQKSERLEIEKYQEPHDRLALSRTHVPFSGSLQKHPEHPRKVILIPDPYSTSIFYFEFDRQDIKYLEKLPNVVNLEGESINMARIWVKKDTIALQCTPFIVNNTHPRA